MENCRCFEVQMDLWIHHKAQPHSEKSHINDAFVIAGGTEQIRKEQNIGKQTQ